MVQAKAKTDKKISSFPPIAAPGVRVLVLGTMPGIASLKAGQYYAHPQNAFWRIMGDLVGAGRDLPYDERVKILMKRGIAVWDVLECCVRPGSLDSNITEEAANDFAAFFSAYPDVRRVFFNGQPASKFFKKFVMSNKDVAATIAERNIQLTSLPSTSPANASWNYERKLKAWREILKDRA